LLTIFPLFFTHLRNWTEVAFGPCTEARHGVVVLDQVVEKSEELTSAVEVLHVNSAILAAHSDYFMRMFSNGMSESSSGVAVVHVSEEGRRDV
jgi:hypothetical protein